jgi:hypothetical protein
LISVTSVDGEGSCQLDDDGVEVLASSADKKTSHRVAWMSRGDVGGIVGATGLTSGSSNACLVGGRDGAMVVCGDPDSKMRAELFASRTQAAARVVSTTAEHGEQITGQMVAEPDGGVLAVSSPAGDRMVAMAGHSSGGALLVRGNLVNGQEKGGAFEVSPGENSPIVRLLNRTNEPVVTLQADDYGNGVVGAWDRKGQGRTLKPGN